MRDVCDGSGGESLALASASCLPYYLNFIYSLSPVHFIVTENAGKTQIYNFMNGLRVGGFITYVSSTVESSCLRISAFPATTEKKARHSVHDDVTQPDVGAKNRRLCCI